MIQTILTALFSFISSLVSFILTPLDNFILSYLPGLSNAFTGIASFLNLCVRSIGWVLSAIGLSQTTIALLVAFFVFKLTVPLLIYAVKLALKWYHQLMP